MIRIISVTDKKLLKKFIDFPHDLYKDDPNYVPELFIAQRDLLTPGKHPFHENADVQLLLAFDENEIKGRIAAIWNKSSNAFNHNNDGFFGFFDCVNQQEVANALFKSAENWLKNRGANKVIGPVNPSTNETCGLLVEGFDSPPIVMMPYNSAYYSELISNAGLSKMTDLVAYRIETKTADDRSVRIHQALLDRLAKNDVVIRNINLKDFKNEARKVREVYNSAWDRNLGFVPMTKNEFDYLAKDLKMIIDPKYCLIAEKKGKMIGFALGIPDINQIMIHVKRGRLLPTGIFKLLLGLKKIDEIRIITLGVIEGYKRLGIEACFYASLIETGRKEGLKAAEASWILEDNYLMNKGIQSINGKAYKKYRIFEKEI